MDDVIRKVLINELRAEEAILEERKKGVKARLHDLHGQLFELTVMCPHNDLKITPLDMALDGDFSISVKHIHCQVCGTIAIAHKGDKGYTYPEQYLRDEDYPDEEE